MFIGDSTARQIHHLLIQHLANKAFNGGGSHSTQAETVVNYPFAAVAVTNPHLDAGTPQGAPERNADADNHSNVHNLTPGNQAIMSPSPTVNSTSVNASELEWTEAFSARFVFHWAPLIEGLAHSIRYGGSHCM